MSEEKPERDRLSRRALAHFHERDYPPNCGVAAARFLELASALWDVFGDDCRRALVLSELLEARRLVVDAALQELAQARERGA